MKLNRMKFGLLQVMTCVVLIGVFLGASPPKAEAQIAPNTYGNILTNSSVWVIGASSTSNINAGAISVRKDRGLALFPQVNSTNSSTAAITFLFDVSYDGSNYNTANSLSFVVAQNGTTAAIGYTNFSPVLLNNVRSLRLKSIQNAHTASCFVSNVIWSVSN